MNLYKMCKNMKNLIETLYTILGVMIAIAIMSICVVSFFYLLSNNDIYLKIWMYSVISLVVSFVGLWFTWRYESECM